MNKMLKTGILCIVFLLCSCQVSAHKLETTQNNLSQHEYTKKAEIISAFSFWINKNCWLYGSSEYADIQNKIKIYYKDKNAKEYYGYLFIRTKNGYDKLAFFIKNDGYQSEPLYVKKVKKTSKKLSYLGNNTFFFDSQNAGKPQFPKSSKKKAAFIKRAKKEITKLLSSNANSKKINYEIYILDFTNADISTDIIVIENGKKMWLSEVVSEVKWDDGKNRKNLARFQGQKSPIIDWTKAENREDFKRQLEMAVCKFKVSA